MSTMTSEKRKEQALAANVLREYFPINSTVYTVLRHVSQSGMSRSISVLTTDENGAIADVTHWVARAMGSKIDQRHGGIKMGGAGMDMGFALVYGLARTIYADGFPCTGTSSRDGRCPSNDHTNEREPNYTVGRLHSDPGYALNHRWI